MRERARRIGAEFSLASDRSGTRIEVRLRRVARRTREGGGM